MLDRQRDFLDGLDAPVLYTPGDKEWTDCHSANVGGFDPLERLDPIRSTNFAQAGKTMGALPADVESQSDSGFPENHRMMHGIVMFVTVHVVGHGRVSDHGRHGRARRLFARSTQKSGFFDLKPLTAA